MAATLLRKPTASKTGGSANATLSAAVGILAELRRRLTTTLRTVDHLNCYKFTSADVRQLLTTEHFDIVHVATYVCPKTGDLVFSDVDPSTGDRICQPGDSLTAEAFASLLKDNRTSLVVIASCESFELAAALLPVTNVVATRDILTPRMFAAWVENFYAVLPNKTLSQAFDYAVKASRAPMKLYAKQDFFVTSATQQATGAAR